MALILGIETTCDETAVGVVERTTDGIPRILANDVRSQHDKHAAYGGIVPEIAARAHVSCLDVMIHRAIAAASVTLDEIDAFAAAAGPGLIGCVVVGLTAAKTLALAMKKPFIAVNHLEAHALTPRLVENAAFPYLLFLASGGHTQLLIVSGVGQFTRIGSTIDDALGETFDKVARMLGLPYPGGPQIDECAETGNQERFRFPRPLLNRSEPHFSFSGLKTAVRHMLTDSPPRSSQDVADVCASFQAAIVDVVCDRVMKAFDRFEEETGFKPPLLVIAGGVAANRAIRKALEALALRHGVRLIAPPPNLCVDNGAMIAWAGLERMALNLFDPLTTCAYARGPLDPRARGLLGSGKNGVKA